MKGEIQNSRTRTDPGGVLQIAGVLTGPPSIVVRLQVLLGPLGSRNLSQKVPLPDGAVLVTTPLPTGLHGQVPVKLADDVVVTQQVSVSNFVVKQVQQVCIFPASSASPRFRDIRGWLTTFPIQAEPSSFCLR